MSTTVRVPVHFQGNFFSFWSSRQNTAAKESTPAGGKNLPQTPSAAPPGDSLKLTVNLSAPTPQASNAAPSLEWFIDTLSKQVKTLTWESLGNLVRTKLDGYPVSLAKTKISARGGAQYELKVYTKGIWSFLRPPLYNWEAQKQDEAKQGPALAKIFRGVWTSLPEHEDSDYGKNKGYRLFRVGRSNHYLAFAKKPADGDTALFYVQDKCLVCTPGNSIASLKDDLANTLGTIDETGFHPTEGKDAEAFRTSLKRLGVSVEDVIAKGRALRNPKQ